MGGTIPVQQGLRSDIYWRAKWLISISWFSLGVVIVISLIATITALTVQRFVGISATSVLVGPFIAAALVIIYSKWRPPNDVDPQQADISQHG